MKTSLTIMILIVLLHVSCNKTIKIVPEFENAKYGGIVYCYNEFGIKNDNSNVEVVAVGENVSTRTNEDGNFELSVPIGLNTFVYTKDGYGKHIDDRVNLIGGIQPVVTFSAKLYKPVDISIKEHNINYFPERNEIIVNGIVNSNTPYGVQMCYKYSINSDIEYFIEIDWEKKNLKIDKYFSGGLGFLEYNLRGNDTVYVAICSKNYYDHGYNIRFDEDLIRTYGSNTTLSDFKMIILEN